MDNSHYRESQLKDEITHIVTQLQSVQDFEREKLLNQLFAAQYDLKELQESASNKKQREVIQEEVEVKQKVTETQKMAAKEPNTSAIQDQNGQLIQEISQLKDEKHNLQTEKKALQQQKEELEKQKEEILDRQHKLEAEGESLKDQLKQAESNNDFYAAEKLKDSIGQNQAAQEKFQADNQPTLDKLDSTISNIDHKISSIDNSVAYIDKRTAQCEAQLNENHNNANTGKNAAPPQEPQENGAHYKPPGWVTQSVKIQAQNVRIKREDEETYQTPRPALSA